MVVVASNFNSHGRWRAHKYFFLFFSNFKCNVHLNKLNCQEYPAQFIENLNHLVTSLGTSEYTSIILLRIRRFYCTSDIAGAFYFNQTITAITSERKGIQPFHYIIHSYF